MFNIKLVLEVISIAFISIFVLFAVYIKIAGISSRVGK